MERKRKSRYTPVIILLAAFVMLTVALIGQNFWFGEERTQEAAVALLDNDSFAQASGTAADGEESGKAECLYLWDSEDASSQLLREQMPQILHDMKVSFREVDISREEIPDYEAFEKVVLGYGRYNQTEQEILDLADWVAGGGDLLIALVPEITTVSEWLCARAGIEFVGPTLYETPGLRLQDELLLGQGKTDYPIEEPFESSLSVSLDSECRVSVTTNDEAEVPLLWQRDYQKGKIVFVNLGIYDKGYRGIYAAAYSMLGEVCAWPVVNGAAYYLDDFPAPIPSGEGQHIEEDYGLSVGDFYTQIWWRDVSSLSEKYGIKYTGMVIEEYSDQVEGPFESLSDSQRFMYFGNSLLDLGGELGYHGYNHMPLCLENFDYRGEYDGYETWRSYEDMKASLEELQEFCEGLYPEESFQVYVPPSNILSEEGRSLIVEEFPNIRAIASLYLGSDVIYEQEYEVSEDGIVETPRVISGYILDDDMRLRAMSELNLHYVSSHFQNSDDVLATDQGEEFGWEERYRRLCDYVEWLDEAASSIRYLTGSEMAGAVQRFYYVDVERQETEEGLALTLSDFQDEAWLLARFNDWEPDTSEEGVDGGTIEHLQGNLYLIKAEEAQVMIKKKV